MRLNAWFVIAAWIGLLASISLLVVGFAGVEVTDLLITVFTIFLAFASGHLILGFYLKCPSCGKRPTVQGYKAIHPTSEKKAGLDGWAVVVINIIRKKQFRCIHCGSDLYV